MGAPGQPNEVIVLQESYSATITIRGNKETKTANDRGYFDFGAVKKEGTLLQVELKAETLEKLKAKINAHVGIVEDDL